MHKCPDSIHKTLSCCQRPSCERFTPVEALPFFFFFPGAHDEVWRSFGRFLCPAQTQLFLSQPHLKCLNSDKRLLDGVQQSTDEVKKKRKKLASFSSFLYIHTHITENKPETQDETYFVFKALTYISPPSPPRSSPAQFTGSIFSLIKNSPSCSSKHFSQGCTITSQKFGGMKGGRINDLF